MRGVVGQTTGSGHRRRFRWHDDLRAASPACTRQEQHDEVSALLSAYSRTRDPKLRDRIVDMHLPLVRYLAGMFGDSPSVGREDLEQVGALALLSAIARFDPGREVSFVTFAVPTILGVMKRQLRDYRWAVKAPRRLRELGSRLRRVRARLETRLGRAPTLTELSAAAEVTEERLVEAMELEQCLTALSLDVGAEETGEESGFAAKQLGAPDPALASVELRWSVDRALRHLDRRARTILHHRFYRGESQSETAAAMGISQMHVSRLERQALLDLRQWLL